MINLKNIGFGILALGLISMTSCKDEEKNEETSPATVMPASNTNTNPTAALNPAHGQPGHDCTIPVGAPLDRSAATNTQTQTQPQMTTGTNSPVRMNNTATGTNTGTAMKNPPHGQPGHDCAVPVGADLPQQ